MKPAIGDFLLLIAVGVILLIADRFLRIETYIDNPKPCGVYKMGLGEKSKCGGNLRCINGFCASENIPLLQKNTLPVFP